MSEELEKQVNQSSLDVNSRSAIATPPELASKYRFVRELGHGTQARVYEAVRLSDDLHVAIKALRIDSVQTWKAYDLFMREAKVLESLSMPGVAKFYEALQFLDQPQPRAYIVQEYIEGESLARMMQKGASMSIQRFFQLAVKLIDLLKALHTHNPPVIHRDIKPSNIILKPIVGDEYECYLIDFGAVANPQVQSGGSTVAGTYGYMPPEQLMGTPQPASDIYSLAVTLTYILSGVPPENMQVSDFRLIIEPHLQGVPIVVADVLRSMLEPNAAKRNCNYDELHKTFENFMHNKFVFQGETVQNNIDVDECIAAVTKLCQEGNLNIWQSLADAVPRKVPDAYLNMQMADIQSMKPLRKQIPFAGFFLSDKDTTENNGKTIGIIIVGIIVGVMLSINIVIIVKMLSSANSNRGMNILGSILYFSPGYIFAICSYSVLNGSRSKYRHLSCYNCGIKLDRLRLPSMDTYSTVGDKNDIQSLLKMGKKSIATIVDCDYFYLDKTMLESYKYLQIPSSADLIYYHGVPVYRVRYRFNPLEDDSPEDLIHAVYIHHIPNANMVPGAPIPILYFVDPSDNSDVMSMPYPYPLGDVIRLRDIYCRTKSGKIY